MKAQQVHRFSLVVSDEISLYHLAPVRWRKAASCVISKVSSRAVMIDRGTRGMQRTASMSLISYKINPFSHLDQQNLYQLSL